VQKPGCGDVLIFFIIFVLVQNSLVKCSDSLCFDVTDLCCTPTDQPTSVDSIQSLSMLLLFITMINISFSYCYSESKIAVTVVHNDLHPRVCCQMKSAYQ